MCKTKTEVQATHLDLLNKLKPATGLGSKN